MSTDMASISNEVPVEGVICEGCKGPIFALEDIKGQREGVGECRNSECPKTMAIRITGARHETLRCRLCGGRNFGHHRGTFGPHKLYCVSFPDHHIVIPPAFSPLAQLVKRHSPSARR